MRARPLSTAMLVLLGLIDPVTAQEAPHSGNAAQSPDEGTEKEKNNTERPVVVATYKDGEVTLDELRIMLAAMPPEGRARYAGPEGRKALLEEALRFELLATEARRRGYDENELVMQRVRTAATQTLLQERVTAKVTTDSLTEEAVTAYYKAHEAEFNVPERRRASSILLKTAAEAEALLTELKGKDLRAFRTAAQHKSVDDSNKLSGGDMRYFDKFGNTESGKAGPAEALAQAAFALGNVGDMAKAPIKTDAGYSLLMLTGKKPKVERPLAEVEGLIRGRLVQEKRQEAVDAIVAKLKTELKPQVHAERIALIKFDAEALAVPKSKDLPEGFPEGSPKKPEKTGAAQP